LIRHAVDTLNELPFSAIIAVIRPQSERLRETLPPNVQLVTNARASDGMGTSIAAGADAAESGLTGVFIALADMPFVEPADYARLAAAFARLDADRKAQAICVPLRDGKRGHPVLFGHGHLPELRRLSGDQGARSLLTGTDAHPVDVDGCSEGIHIDLDDQAAFAEAEGRLRRKP